jgi:hypothetical protein
MLKESPLVSLNGRRLDGYIVQVGKISRGRFIEETNFELYLRSPEGETSKSPVMWGKYFSGRGKFYKPWIEVYYEAYATFELSNAANLSEKNSTKNCSKISQVLYLRAGTSW